MTNLKKTEVNVLWNKQVQTDGTISTAKPDVIIHDNEEGTCMLVDVEIQGDRNVLKKEAGKFLNYKELTIEIQSMCTVKTKVIPVILAETEAIPKAFRKYLNNLHLPGRHDIKELQKRSMLSYARVLWAVLM